MQVRCRAALVFGLSSVSVSVDGCEIVTALGLKLTLTPTVARAEVPVSRARVSSALTAMAHLRVSSGIGRRRYPQ